jgi:hypothetical protein
MAEGSYGVYVSIRRPTGELVSINRETVGQVEDDLKEILGEDNGFWKRFADVEVNVGTGSDSVQDGGAGSQAPVAPASSLDARPPAGPSPSAAPAPGLDDLPPAGFESCEKCGTLKDKWNPPGHSTRTNRDYPGFWGCPNFRNH